MRSNRGFTLIELLVVIAIIAILAAILFPVFAKAREKARSATCQSNEKQISLGVLQYIQDYDEKFPSGFYFTNTGGTDQPWGPWKYTITGWDKAVQPYLKNAQVFKCPSASGLGWGNADDTEPTGAVNYCLNRRVAGRVGSDWGETPINSAALKWPAVTIMLSESNGYSGSGSVSDEVAEWGWTGTHGKPVGSGFDGRLNDDNWGQVAALKRHNEGSNFAFSDGHVKWFQWSKTLVVNGPNEGNPTMVDGVQQNRSGQDMTYWPN